MAKNLKRGKWCKSMKKVRDENETDKDSHNEGHEGDNEEEKEPTSKKSQFSIMKEIKDDKNFHAFLGKFTSL
jgi:hypothetical protein